MGVALLYHGLNHGLNGVLFSVGGLFAGMAFLIIPYLVRGMGAGDVKLLGAAGAVLGANGVVNAFLFTALAGGVYALFISVLSGYAPRLMGRYAGIFRDYLRTGHFVFLPADQGEAGRKPKLCYGVAIALGTLFTMGWHLAYGILPVPF